MSSNLPTSPANRNNVFHLAERAGRMAQLSVDVGDVCHLQHPANLIVVADVARQESPAIAFVDGTP